MHACKQARLLKKYTSYIAQDVPASRKFGILPLLFDELLIVADLILPGPPVAPTSALRPGRELANILPGTGRLSSMIFAL